MSQATKAELWQELKEAGITFPLHYRQYSTEQLRVAADKLKGQTIDVGPVTVGAPEFSASEFEKSRAQFLAQEEAKPAAPVRSTPDEVAGIRQNTHTEDEPLRVDPETGFIWYQDEVRKSAYPKPRGRRVLKYKDTGVKTMTVKEDETYSETFEMPGDANRISEARITLPSYQVGIYRNPNQPFKIHVYNGMEGYDLFEVEEYYNGKERVPAEVKRIYVLCYDIRSVHQAIETEYRERVLNVSR